MFDSSSCKACHTAIYEAWEKSHHSRSLYGMQKGPIMAPLALKNATAFSPSEPGKATVKTYPCFKCHLPQAVTHADDAFAVEYTKALIDSVSKEADEKKRGLANLGKLSITCIVCHNEKAIIHRLQDGQPEEGVLYGTKDVAEHGDKKFKKVKKGKIMTHAIMCGQCHGLGPNLEFDNPVQCATLYGSYEHFYIPMGGSQQCQDCHMKKVGGVADHLIAPNFEDHANVKAKLQEALHFDVHAYAYEFLRKGKSPESPPIPMIVLNSKTTNMAGHRVPDG
jgi:excinuclease UvrABC ATPase subunit